MSTRQIALLLATVIFAAAAYAGDKEHQKMEIKVISEDGDGETHLTLDSDDLDFDLHEMQVGENRSIIDKEGRTVLVTRKEDGYSFDIDGKTIDMPLIGPHGEKMEWTFDGDHDEDVDIHVMHGGMGHPPMMFDDGVMIISGKEIDAATQEIIRNALEATGHENVHFADRPEGGPHRVHVVKEVVEVKD
jgi:hypothetical protein